MKSYDLRLPEWGPYNKNYLGAAHIADPARGYRFDVNLFPGYYRRSVMLPRDVADCGAKLLASSADLTHYVIRYELEWKDRVYLEADFCSSGRELRITCDFVNETDAPESLTLNAVMSLQRSTNYKSELVDLQVSGARWLDAVDYTGITTAQKLAQDGLYLGERRGSGFVGGSFISQKLFGREGDRLVYAFAPVETDRLGIRYRGEGSLTLLIGDRPYEINLKNAPEPVVEYLEIPRQTLGRFSLLPHNAELDLDGFVLEGDPSFDDGAAVLQPELTEEKGKLLLRFGELAYTVECDHPQRVLRRLNTEDPGKLLTDAIHNHVSTVLGKGPHGYADLFVRPVFLEPHSKKRITLRITAPSGSFQGDPQLCLPVCNEAGKRFSLSQQIMAAVTLTNVVWPIYSRRGYIRHNTPGRNWDSLYTWDSGFIGMGLAELDLRRAEDCLNAYFTPVEDLHSPYIFHGSPVPTQIFLLAELYNKTGDAGLIEKYYEMARQQYRFFARRPRQENGLFSTWDIFYNSGGWDDYPTQVYLHEQKLEGSVCPMVNVSVTVLCARILRLLAGVIGADTAEYDADIAALSRAVEAFGWDEASGYYGYVNGRELLKLDGVNADMGLDGAYPYIAGISCGERARRVAENLKAGCFTPIGVSVVDTRAPYYRTDGYWNGSVWMPHQWILWKAFLDRGEAEAALYIAETALQVWENEVSRTYNCYEHFMIANGRGAGFHQFSGLSTPVLMWFNALYRPGTVTGGFQTLISEKQVGSGGLSFRVQAEGPAPTVLVCLEENKEYCFETSGRVQKLKTGTYCISFPGPIEENISISRSENIAKNHPLGDAS